MVRAAQFVNLNLRVIVSGTRREFVIHDVNRLEVRDQGTNQKKIYNSNEKAYKGSIATFLSREVTAKLILNYVLAT